MRTMHTTDDSERQAKRRARRGTRIVFLMLLLIISPIVYEGGMVVFSRWQNVLGRNQRLETPILDFIGQNAGQFRYEFRGVGTSAFRKIEWKPSIIVPMAFGFAGLGAWFLRRGI